MSNQSRGASASDSVLDAVITRHHKWLKQYWTPNRQSYIGLGMGYTEFEWKQAFEKYDRDHPKLAMFMAEAMKHYADTVGRVGRWRGNP